MNFSFQLTVKIGRHCPRRDGTFDAVIVKGRPLPADAYGNEGMRQTPTQSVVQQQVKGDTATHHVARLLDVGKRRLVGASGRRFRRPPHDCEDHPARLLGRQPTRFLRTNVALKKENAGRLDLGLRVDRKGRQKDLASKASSP